MSRGHIQGFAQQGGHTVVVAGNNSTTKFQESYPGCSVTVYLAGTTTTATIYSDMAGTSKSNPFTSDSTTAYWDFYAESTQRYDVKFSGTGIGTAFTLPDLRVATDPIATINVKDYGAVGDGTTDDTTAIGNALSLLGSTSGYAELYFPPGTYKTTAHLSVNVRDHVRIRGAGMYQSILLGTHFGGLIFDVNLAARNRGLEIQDLGFSTNTDLTAIYLNGNNESDTIAIERCRFVDLSGITLDGPVNARIENCVFQGLGHCDWTAITSATSSGDLSVSQLRIAGNEFRYTFQGIFLNTPPTAAAPNHPHEYIQIVDNYFDGGWYTQVATFSGNATSFTSTSINTGVTITGVPAGAYVRVLVPYNSGGTAAVDALRVTDSGATFQTWGVKRGSILRRGSAFAIVQSVESQTVLWVEEWLSDADRTPIPTPAAAASSYTVYKVILGSVTSVSGSTINVVRWLDLDGATVSTPASGTRFEVQNNFPGHSVFLHRSVSRAVVDRNRLLRCQSDQLSINGDRCRITNNVIEFGQDMGITLADGVGHVVTGNTIIHQGVNCISAFRSSDHVISSNHCVDAMSVNDTSSAGACIRLIDSSRVVVSGNHCERSVASQDNLRYAVLVESPEGHSDRNLIVANLGYNFSTSNPWYLVTGANCDENQLLDNAGGASSSASGATNTTIRTAGTGGISSSTQPRAVAYMSGNLSVGYSYTKIGFDQNSMDVGGVHSTSTNNTRFTAPVAGVYLAIGQVFFHASSAGSVRAVRIGINNSGAYAGWVFQEPGDPNWPKVLVTTAFLQMAAGDYIEFEASQDVTSSTIDGGNVYNTFGSLLKVW